MSKKVKTSLVIGSAAILLLAIILVVVNNYSNSENHTDDNITIVGTWYSDKPDSVTFTEDGTYSFAAWNGGNPWLTFDGTYTVEDSTVTMQNQLDGENCLTISKAEDGGVILTGRYTYYQTEEAAKAAISITEEKATEDAANIIPNTVNELLGEWTSLDGTVTCTFTEKSFIVYFKGNDVVPEETLYREYEILSDKQIKIYKNGVANIYNYSLTERWKQAGDVSPYYDLKKNTQTSPTSRFVQDLNVLNFSSLSCGYDFQYSMIKKIRLNSLGIRFNANDLCRWSTVKEERGTSYPYSKNYSITLTLGF